LQHWRFTLHCHSRTIAATFRLSTAPMSDDRDKLHASAPMQALYARELAALASIVSGVYGNFGLFLRPHGGASAPLPAHLLGKMIELAPRDDGSLEGALCCSPEQMPFANESFKLVIVQHALEQIDKPESCVAELARVLAPEGVALILGFNPLGTWRPWLSLQAASLCPRSAHNVRMLLAHEQVDTLQVRFPGSLWPHANIAAEPGKFSAHLARFGSSWLLLARKRRSSLTPLRLRSAPRELALNPRLAPGAHRNCA
jgi:SAM-dependent methyltransferase